MQYIGMSQAACLHTSLWIDWIQAHSDAHITDISLHVETAYSFTDSLHVETAYSFTDSLYVETAYSFTDSLHVETAYSFTDSLHVETAYSFTDSLHVVHRNVTGCMIWFDFDLIEHFYSAHILSIECSERLADVLACSQKVSHPERRLVSADIGASFHFSF
jgi:hypothetical protein